MDLQDPASLSAIKSKLICTYSVDMKSLDAYAKIERAVLTGECARYYVKSSPVTGRCIPSVIAELVPSQEDIQALNGMTTNSTGDQGKNNRSFNASAIASPSGKK